MDVGTIIHRTDAAVSCELGDGAAILDTKSNCYFSLNAAGAVIWEALPSDPPSLTQRLIERFGIDATRAAADVRDMLSQLETAGLVRMHRPEST